MTRSTRRTRSNSSRKEEEQEEVSQQQQEEVVKEDEAQPPAAKKPKNDDEPKVEDAEAMETTSTEGPNNGLSSSEEAHPPSPPSSNGLKKEEQEEKIPKEPLEKPEEKIPKESLEEAEEKIPKESLEKAEENIPKESLEEAEEKIPKESLKKAEEKIPKESLEKAEEKIPKESLEKPEEEEPKKKSPELERYWSSVKEDPMDFSSWTSLLQYADANGDLEEGREAYDAFLDRYPYCYGYWKKYADLEKRKGSPQRTMSVFERGISAICLSADLWIHYLNHVKTLYEEDFIRTQYERAVGACGLEWRSDKLWDHYVKWESGQKRFTAVLGLYDRILRNPTQGLTHQFEMFRDFVKEHKPKEILGPEEFLRLRKEVLQAMQTAESVKQEEPAPESGENTEEEDIAMKEKIIFIRKRVYKDTEEFVQERWKYEDVIKRPYFHMKPLERGQLKNWTEYLDFEIQKVHSSKRRKSSEEKSSSEDSNRLVNDTRVEILFERCLIACALYEEFWFKYIDWLSKRKGGDFTEKIRSVYKKACEHHLRQKVDIHLRRAEFEEKQGDLSLAGDIFRQLESKYPDAVGFSLKRINIHRRQGNHEVVRRLFESTLERKSGRIRSEIAVKYGRYLRLIHGEVEGALRVLEESLPLDEKNPKIYLQILDIYLHGPLDLSKIASLFDAAISKVGPEDALLFSQRKVEFLEDFGSDIAELEAAKSKDTALRKECRSSLSREQHSSSKSDAKNNADSSSSVSSNSASYNAHHNSQYQQYGARYSYNGGGSGAYGAYYPAAAAYSGSYAGY